MSKSSDKPSAESRLELERLRAESLALRAILRESQVTQYHIWVDSKVEPDDPHFQTVRRIIERTT